MHFTQDLSHACALQRRRRCLSPHPQKRPTATELLGILDGCIFRALGDVTADVQGATDASATGLKPVLE